MLIKMRSMMQRKETQKGFTLVELIVVMAILAVLAGLAVPQFTGVLSGAKTDAHNANKAMIEKAAELYYAKEGTAAANIGVIVDAKYLKEVPANPTGGDAYTCVITEDGAITVGP